MRKACAHEGLGSTAFSLNLVEQAERFGILVRFKKLPDLAQVAVNQKQLVRTRAAATSGFFLEIFPESIGFARVVDMATDKSHQMLGFLVAVDPNETDVTIRLFGNIGGGRGLVLAGARHGKFLQNR